VKTPFLLASASGWQDWLVRRQDAASFPGYAALAFCFLKKSPCQYKQILK
jgi:hypothetical protein